LKERKKLKKNKKEKKKQEEKRKKSRQYGNEDPNVVEINQSAPKFLLRYTHDCSYDYTYDFSYDYTHHS
jgi:hypothetical protein